MVPVMKVRLLSMMISPSVKPWFWRLVFLEGMLRQNAGAAKG
jgi:hypothetical protein